MPFQAGGVRSKFWACTKLSTGLNGHRLTRNAFAARETDKKRMRTDTNGLKFLLSVGRPLTLSGKVWLLHKDVSLDRLANHCECPCSLWNSDNSHTLSDSVNGRTTDRNFREENYPVVNVVSVAGRGSLERSMERTKRTMIAQIPDKDRAINGQCNGHHRISHGQEPGKTKAERMRN